MIFDYFRQNAACGIEGCASSVRHQDSLQDPADSHVCCKPEAYPTGLAICNSSSTHLYISVLCLLDNQPFNCSTFVQYLQSKANTNGCRICVDIMTGEKLSIQFNMEITYWSVRLYTVQEGRGLGKGGGRENRYFSQLHVSFYWKI